MRGRLVRVPDSPASFLASRALSVGGKLRLLLEPWAPGSGRIPGFESPLLCPSVVKGVEPEWVERVRGLPAARIPDGFDPEPAVYDGRIGMGLR